jgi:hypothetical protein
MIIVQYETKRNGEHSSGWAGTVPTRSALTPTGLASTRWMITRDGRSVASGVAADRDQAANDAAAALSGLPG